jgi:hypothetical protein
MNRVDEIVIVPHRATKITQEPAMAEAT